MVALADPQEATKRHKGIVNLPDLLSSMMSCIDQLKSAPTYGADELPAWGDRVYETRIHDYYKTAPYWSA